MITKSSLYFLVSSISLSTLLYCHSMSENASQTTHIQKNISKQLSPLPVITASTTDIDQATSPITPPAQPSDNQKNITPTTTQKTIKITNNITPKMLQYKHWTGSYKPTKFIVTANGAPIKENQTIRIPANNNSLTVRYEYEFMNGMRKGDKEVVFTLKEGTQAINLTFSWKNESRFIIDQQVTIDPQDDINQQSELQST